MDRYVQRERRNAAENPHPNQTIGFNQVGASSSSANNIIWFEPEKVVYGGFGHDLSNVQYPVHKTGVILQNPRHVMSEIDPRYLAAYASNNASYVIPGPQKFPVDQNNFTTEASDTVYYSDNMTHFVEPEKPTTKMYANKRQVSVKVQKYPRKAFTPMQSTSYENTPSSTSNNKVELQKSVSMPLNEETKKRIDSKLVKNEAPNEVKLRLDKLKALNKSGPRVFSGPVEKVLKWHKVLQDVGILILYEIVAKCISVRVGDSSAKILLIRDKNGPAMQVVYYEIDFLLPNLKPPCMIRVAGRMLRGTSRLQAFSVRVATGDDVGTLPRRAAIADQQVSKLSK